MKHVFLFGIFGWFLSFTLVAQTGIWQWSVPVHNFSTHPKNPESRAYLWIPSQCEQVKAILVAQHNMEEISILEDEVFRQRMVLKYGYVLLSITDLILRMGHGKLWMVFWQILLKNLDIKSCLQLL